MIHTDLRGVEADVALRSSQASLLGCPDQDRLQAGVSPKGGDLIQLALTFVVKNWMMFQGTSTLDEFLQKTPANNTQLVGHYKKDSPMNQPVLSCPKCNGEMLEGFVMDSTFGAALVSQWVKGKQNPKKQNLHLEYCLPPESKRRKRTM